MRGDPAFGDVEVERRSEPKRFQFSLATMLKAVLYAGLLATLTVNLAGKQWSDVQVAVAYFVTSALVAGFVVVSKARGSVAAYLILSPLILVLAVCAANVFRLNGAPTTSPPNPVPPVQRTPLVAP